MKQSTAFTTIKSFIDLDQIFKNTVTVNAMLVKILHDVKMIQMVENSWGMKEWKSYLKTCN